MPPRGESRAKLIDAMRELSLTKGYPATTVDEVCATAEVSKGSFYHHFQTKEDIGNAALDSHFDELLVALTDEGDQSGAAPSSPTGAVDRLHAFLDRASAVCSGPLLVNGCMLGSFALDLAETHPEVRARLDEQFTTLADYVAELIDAAGAEVGVELPTAALARQFLALIEGSIVLAKAHDDHSILATALDLFTQHLDLLLDRGRPPEGR